jgi:GNAT superfamily N-acetyltransferase
MNSRHNKTETADSDIHILPIMDDDRSWVSRFLISHWYSTEVITRCLRHQADVLPGFIAYHDHIPIGLLTYQIEGKECEIISLNSTIEGKGIGTALINKIKTLTEKLNLKRLWVITTNDNIDAIRFYQKRGFHLAALHPNALRESRKLKPTIPLIGIEGIPIRDEIEFEILMKNEPASMK